MYIVYLLTHAIMAICFLSILSTWFDLPNHRVKRIKGRAIIPVLKEDQALKEPGFKNRILKNTPAGIEPKSDQKIFSQSLEFRFDMERLN
jgi:hypothetical protein